MKRIVLAVLAATSLAAPASAVVFTTTQLQQANDGLQAMRELNLIVITNLSSKSEVEGKAFVGGNVAGDSENFGFGSSAHPNEGFYQNNSRATLTVGGNLSINATLSNGATKNSAANNASMNVSGNGSPTLTDSRFDIGGNMTGAVTDNIANSTIRTGGSFNNTNFNPNATKTARYGTTASNVQVQDQAYVVKDAALANASTGLAASIAAQTSTLKTNLSMLSNVLANLNTNATLNTADPNQVKFAYTAAANTAAFVVVNVPIATLTSLGSATYLLDLLNAANTNTGIKTTVINVTGLSTSTSVNTTYTIGGQNNDNYGDNDQNLIWNFNSVAGSLNTINFSGNSHGSILAPNATIVTSTQVNGSVVSNAFNQGGEVHLGTFNGTSLIVANNPAIPEPGTWATMVGGFGMIGFALRRTRRRVAFAG